MLYEVITMAKKALLMILDGWGIGNGSKSDVIATVGAPNMEKLAKDYPSAQLLTDGNNVGLPKGQIVITSYSIHYTKLYEERRTV